MDLSSSSRTVLGNCESEWIYARVLAWPTVGGFDSSGHGVASAELYDPGVGITRKVQGRGAFDYRGNQVTFNFSANQSEGGTLGYFSFCDPAASVCVTKARIWSLSFAGNTAEVSGRDDASRVRVSATDNGEPGTSDTISISLRTGYSVSGNLISGDIRIQ
jgi:hypothetical protein